MKATINDGGMLDLWQRKLRRASKVLRSDPVAQRHLYGSRLSNLISYWTGAVVARNMAKKEDSQGASWAPLSKATVDLKNRDSRGRIGKRKRAQDPERPLVDSGSLFKSFAPSNASTTGGVPKAIRGGSVPKFELSPSSGKLTVKPRGKSPKGVSWETLFRVHNKPTTQKTTLKGNKNFKKRVDSGGKSTPIADRQYEPVSIPGREFFYFTPKDLKFLGKMLSYAALVGGPVNEKGDPVAKGVRGVGTGTQGGLKRKRLQIESLVDADTKRILRNSGAIDLIRSIR